MNGGMQAVQRFFGWPLSVVLLLATMAAAAQVPSSSQNAQAAAGSPGSGTTTTAAGGAAAAPATLTPGVTITGQAPSAHPLPKFPADEFTNCTRKQMGLSNPDAEGTIDIGQMATRSWLCENKLNHELQVVIDACLDRSGENPLPRIIQACTESLEHKALQDDERFFLIASRAEAYFADGDWQHALDDYNAAIKAIRFAPHHYAQLYNAALYYDRGLVFVSRSDDDDAVRDFDTAMDIDARLDVPALSQRARIYAVRGNLSSALADYSKAISLQPKTAGLWSDRGYVALNQRDYDNAVKDETQAIQLDPKLARAYYLRGVAFGDLGNRVNAVGDLQTAVGLDASLARYVVIQGKNVTLKLPPL